MKTLDLQRWKKLRLQLSLTVRNDFATEFHSSLHQNLRFNNFKLFFESNYCNLKYDCEWIKIPFLFLENSFASVSNSILYVQKFLTFASLVWKQKRKNEKWFAMIAFHSVLTQLRILIWSKSCFWPSAFVLQPPNSPLKNTVNEIRYSRKNHLIGSFDSRCI